jgi:MFS family permease
MSTQVLPAESRPWWRIPHLLKLNAILLVTMLFSATMGYDNSMMNGLQSLPQWQSFMEHPKGTYLGAINATQAAGSCVGYAIMSFVANRFGRKSSVYAGCLVLTFGTILQTTSRNAGSFIASRLFVGVSSGLFGAAPALITECAYPTHRGKLTAGYNCLYYLGSLLSAWTVFGTRNYTTDWAWRVPSLVQVCTPVVAIWALMLAPESPRWLMSEGRVEEARKIFVKYHAGGDESSPLVKFEMLEVQQAIDYEKRAAAQTSYMDMLRTSGNRHRTLISVTLGIFAQWNGSGVVSVALIQHKQPAKAKVRFPTIYQSS